MPSMMVEKIEIESVMAALSITYDQASSETSVLSGERDGNYDDNGGGTEWTDGLW